MSEKSMFSIVYHRDSKVKKFFVELLLLISSYPRLLIESFTRTQFGQRYYSLISVVVVFMLMLYMPFLLTGNFDFAHPKYYFRNQNGFAAEYGSWFLYTIVFFIVACLHFLEMEKNGSIFESKRFSLSTGILHPIFDKIKIPFINDRLKIILIEPLPFFILGFILWKFGQPLGMLLMISSLIYSLSYIAAFNGGDNFIMDIMDEIIFNEELENAIVHDMKPEKTRGVRIFSDKPTSEDLRQKLYEAVSEKEESVIAI